MRFSKSDETYQASRITGPSHNLLRIQLQTGEAPSEIPVEELPTSSTLGDSALRPDDLRAQVLQGVSEANEEFSTEFGVTKIFFVPDDTPSPDVYRELARSIVARIANGGEFQPLSLG